MEYRKDSGEKVDENSWVMRQLWNLKSGLSDVTAYRITFATSEGCVEFNSYTFSI